MSCEKALAYLRQVGLGDRLVIREHASDTVEHAAQACGCIPAQIAKTMSFLVEGKAVLIVAAGDARVNSSAFKKQFHVKAQMVPWDQVEAMTGHAPGGVCPFGIPQEVRTFLDVLLRRFSRVHVAGGSGNATAGMSCEELERCQNFTGWVDICRDWDPDLRDEDGAPAAGAGGEGCE